MMDFDKALNDRFLLQEEYLGNNKIVNSITPIVSVTVATYQHVNYIKECLDGILMQQTNFPYEIILGEDGSVDGTQEICKEYAEKYSDKIRLFIRDRNLSQFYNEKGQFVGRFNGIWNRMSARGKYIAWCEGDDYWTDPMKLQKQVDFLEENDDCGLCFHDAVIEHVDKDIKKTRFKIPRHKFVFGTREIFRLPWFIPTASIVFRASLLPKNIPLWAAQAKSGDVVLQLMISKNGYLYYLPCSMSVYRLGTPYSLTTQNKKNPLQNLKNYIKTLESANKEYFNNEYIWDVRYRKLIYFYSIIKYYLNCLFT